MHPTDSTSSNSTERRFICVAYAFPPINRSGTFRTLGFIKHLAGLGWTANVITSETKNEPVDEGLLNEIPDGVEVQRIAWEDRVNKLKRALHLETSARSFNAYSAGEVKNALDTSLIRSKFHGVKDWVSGLLHLPDSRSGWIQPAIRAGKHILRSRPIELIYSTSPYASAHLIAMKLKRQSGLPWVADFRDPWCGNPYAKNPVRFHQHIEERMERAVLKRADRIIVNTPTAREKLCKRYPNVENKCVTILNGFDLEIIDLATPYRSVSPETFSLVHCGQFYGPRSPIFLFRALKVLMLHSPQLATRFKLTLVGNENYDGKSLGTLAKEFGVDSLVEVVGAKSHSDAIRYMAGSDALTLVGSVGANADLQIPNKLFEYIAMRKPIMACLPNRHPAIEILRRSRIKFTSCRPNDVANMAMAIRNLIVAAPMHDTNTAMAVSQYDRKHRAKELADVFNQLVDDRKPANGRILHQASANVDLQGQEFHTEAKSTTSSDVM